MTMAIQTAVTGLREASEKINGNAPVDCSNIEPGDMMPQGDIGVICLGSLPANRTELEWKEGVDFQLAPGTNKGSRHKIPAHHRGDLTIYNSPDGVLSDFVIDAKAPFDITHPDHADHLNYPSGCYRIQHQMTASLVRVKD